MRCLIIYALAVHLVCVINAASVFKVPTIIDKLQDRLNEEDESKQSSESGTITNRFGVTVEPDSDISGSNTLSESESEPDSDVSDSNTLSESESEPDSDVSDSNTLSESESEPDSESENSDEYESESDSVSVPDYDSGYSWTDSSESDSDDSEYSYNSDSESESDSETLEAIESHLEVIKEVVVENRHDETERRLPQDCVDAIRSRNMHRASSILDEIDDSTKINWIVKEVYDSSFLNYDLIDEFIDSIDDSQIKLKAYEALTFEIAHNPFPDCYSTYCILDKVRETTKPEVSILVYEEMKDKIEKNYLVEFASGLKLIMESPDYENLMEEYRESAAEVKYSLPACIRNIVFGDKVVIKNIQLGEYLYASDIVTDEKRQISSKHTPDVWTVSLDEREYAIFTNKYGEHLSSISSWGDDGNYNEGPDYTVFSSSEGAEKTSVEKWLIQPVGDNCYLKNYENSGRLFISKETKLAASYLTEEDDEAYLFNVAPASDDVIHGNEGNLQGDEGYEIDSELLDKLSEDCQKATKYAHSLSDVSDITKAKWVAGQIANFNSHDKFCNSLEEIKKIHKLYSEIYDLVVEDGKLDETELSVMIKQLEKRKENASGIDAEIIADILNHLYLDAAEFEEDDSLNIDEQLTYYRQEKTLKKKILGFAQINNKFKRMEDPELIMRLAYYLKEAMNYPTYDLEKSEIKKIAENIKASLPSCVRNVIFSSKVHIKNKKLNNYLFATNVLANRDHWRLISTGYTKDIWEVKLQEGGETCRKCIRIALKDEFGEYLYSKPPWVTYLDHSHVRVGYFEQAFQSDLEVYAYTPKELNSDGFWAVEPKGDYCYLTNDVNDAKVYVHIYNKWVYSHKSRTIDDSNLFSFVPIGQTDPGAEYSGDGSGNGFVGLDDLEPDWDDYF